MIFTSTRRMTIGTRTQRERKREVSLSIFSSRPWKTRWNVLWSCSEVKVIDRGACRLAQHNCSLHARLHKGRRDWSGSKSGPHQWIRQTWKKVFEWHFQNRGYQLIQSSEKLFYCINYWIYVAIHLKTIGEELEKLRFHNFRQ